MATEIIIVNQILDLDKICRICLSEGEMKPIFTESSDEVKIHDVLTLCHLKVSSIILNQNNIRR